jgi:hypothetical protein
MDRTIEMLVTVTVTPPEGIKLTDERAIELAMSSVTQFHEVECGRKQTETSNTIAWAKVHAEVSDSDCIIEKI